MISGLKATAYNMEGGKLVKSKMESSMVFNERVDDDYSLCKFTVPNVKVGTVIEYQYTKVSNYVTQIDDWYAQDDIPTAYTSYSVEVPEYFVFDCEMTGFHRIEQNVGTGSQSYLPGSAPCSTKAYSFVGRNLPAIVGDSYVWCPRQYSNLVSFELRSIDIPGYANEDYASSWSDIDKTFSSDDSFGGRLRRSNPLRDEMKSAGIASISDFGKKIEAVWKLVTSRVKWNGDYELYGNPSRDVLKEGTASNADINFLIMNVLDDLGMKCTPVMLRLRGNGRLPVTHPTKDYINTFVVGVMKDDTTMVYLDGSAEHGYINTLPACLLTLGHPMKGVGGADTANLQRTELDLAITPDGNAAVSMTQRNDCGECESSLSWTGQNVADRNKRLLRMLSLSAADVKSLDVAETKTDLTATRVAPRITLTSTVSCRNYAGKTGTRMFIPVNTMRRTTDSMKTRADRCQPVEIDYGFCNEEVITLHLPEGYTIESIPRDAALTTDVGSFSSTVVCDEKNRTVHVRQKLTLHKGTYPATSYQSVCNIYNAATKEYSQKIVLKAI